MDFGEFRWTSTSSVHRRLLAEFIEASKRKIIKWTSTSSVHRRLLAEFIKASKRYFSYIYFMKGWMYILECSDGSYYTGSTNNLELRLQQHQSAQGANHTKNRLPVKLVYFEEFERIEDAFYREKQIQGWRREKKEALIKGNHSILPALSLSNKNKKELKK